MRDYIAKIEQKLTELLRTDFEPHVVAEAMLYSASAGGKRIRPSLAMEFCRLCGKDPADALYYGCAVEMIHTYSLIHDDLPCMDDDDYRRGRPSCHKQFGEANALLAGDGLLTKAFETIALAPLNAESRIQAVSLLSYCAGVRGMIGGQEKDLFNEGKTVPLEELRSTDLMKTGALLKAACQLGVIAASGSDEAFKKAGEYAENMGLAFQIVDDILDVTGDEALLGKPIGSDSENKKSTYVSVLGLEKAKEVARQYSEKAVEALKHFPDSEYLQQYTLSLLNRDH